MGECEQALKSINYEGRLQKESYGRQPNLGNPAVLDENGGLMKCELWYFGLRPIVKAVETSPKPKIAHASNLSRLYRP